jgi:hypothetical protein
MPSTEPFLFFVVINEVMKKLYMITRKIVAWRKLNYLPPMKAGGGVND